MEILTSTLFAIYTEEQENTIPQIVEPSKPELAGFIGSYCDAEDIFVHFHCNTKNNISSTAYDPAILPDFVRNTVHKDKRINRVQRTGLPLFERKRGQVATKPLS